MIPYIERTRNWYLALGYANPYRWAHFDEVPFTPLRRPLADCTVALVTTAAPYQPGKGPQGPGAPYNAAAKFFEPYSGDTSVDHDLRISHVAVDRRHANLEDSNCWFPLPLLRERVKLARRFHGAPTNRSQRHTLEVDAPLIVQRCQEDGADAAVLVPNCPVCHQTVSLIARELERAGIATVIVGAAKDIVEHVGVPRFLFSDFPLGNACGKPFDRESQAQTLDLALRLLQEATPPRTTWQSPQRWSGSDEWKLDYCNPERATPAELAAARAEFDAAKAVASTIPRNLR
ncbi:glycine reductase [Ramlibacter albus]|uniref:Glycine reductase n=1 Tax=Ramlibacter albus TaxID=2079448 RepID=A0A923MAZ9_9BURK|nr:glycine reductase [Ramlibacter albus]MBC5766033.1 glycine reductase [Ramlibacter albus]